MSQQRHRTLFALSVAWLVVVSGCGKDSSGPPTAVLAGEVTINGAAVPAGTEARIQFMPQTAGTAPPASTTIENGAYRADNVPIGKVKVLFNITRLTGRMVVEEGAPGGAPYQERENLVPTPYQVGIDLDVAGDKLDQDFELNDN